MGRRGTNIHLLQKICSLPLAVALLCGALLSTSLSAFGQEVPEKPREREKDDPRARAEYLRQKLGAEEGQTVGGARLQALREMKAKIEEEGRQFRESFAAASSATTKSIAMSGGSASASSPVKFSIASNASSWTPIGPSQTTTHFGAGSYAKSSGRVTAIAVDPTDASGNTVYVGGAQGGVWKTTDGGANWAALTDNQPSLAIGSLAIDPNNHLVIYAGTGEENFSGDSYYGAGVLKSTDGGGNWNLLGNGVFGGGLVSQGQSGPLCSSDILNCGGAFIGALAINPGNSQVLLAAADRSGAAGLYRSQDGGVSWSVLTGAGINIPATDVVFVNSTTAFAGFKGNGVYRSTDGGISFSQIGIGIIVTGGTGVVKLAAVGSVVYAAVANLDSMGTLSGFYRSTDGGNTWTRLGPNAATNGALTDFCTSQCFYDMVIAINPSNTNVVFVGGSATADNFGSGVVSDHIFKSIDGGVTWTPQANGIHVDHHAARFASNGKLYWGNDGGVYSTTDTSSAPGTVSWTNLNSNLNLTQFYPFFAIHPTDAQITFGGSQDNGTQKFSGSPTWDYVACGDGASAVFDPVTPTTVYSGCQGIDVRKSSTGNKDTFLGAGGSGTTGIPANENVAFIPPLVGDPNNSGVLYFGTYRVWQTLDGAITWHALSNDVTGGGVAIGGPTISNIAVAPSNSQVVYTATSNGKVASSSTALSGSLSFTDITGSGLLMPSVFINAIAVDPGNANIAYVALAGFKASNHIFRATINGGSTIWTSIDGDLPNTPVNDLVIDPDIGGTIYAATDVGVYRTTNSGTNWTPLMTALPHVAVFGLKLHRPTRTLRAATHGRGMWDLYVPTGGTVQNGPNATLSPGSLDFGNVPPSSPGPKTIMLANNGNAGLVITSIAASGQFGVTDGCPRGPTQLAPNTSCTINVSFNPTNAGQLGGFVTVTSNALNGTGTVRAALTGVSFLAPANDNFKNATLINSGSFNDRVFITPATQESSRFTLNTNFSDPFPDAICVGGAAFFGAGRDHTVWYSYTPSVNGTVTIDTSGSDYDTVVSMWTGNLRDLVEVGCNDDINPGVIQQSHLSVPVTTGVSYSIMVGSYAVTNVGTMAMIFSGPSPLAPQPPNFSLSVTQAGRGRRPVRSATNIIIAGQAASFTVNVMPNLSSEQSVTLLCSGAPVGTTCTVEPGIVNLRGSSEVSVVIRTAAPLGGAASSRTSQRARRLGGSGRRESFASDASAATPPGNYSVRLDARAGDVVKSVGLSFVVAETAPAPSGSRQAIRARRLQSR